MAEVVDAIIGRLELQIDQYRQNANEVISINGRMRKSILAAGGDDNQLQKAAASQTAIRRRMTDDEKSAAKEARDVVKQAAKEKADAEKAAAKLAADAVKAAERDKQDGLRATARESASAAKAATVRADAEKAASAAVVAATDREIAARARLAEVVAEGIRNRASFAAAPNADHGPHSEIAPPSSGFTEDERERLSTFYSSPSRGPNLDTDTGASAEVAAQREINHLALDTYDLRLKARVAKGDELAEIQRELEYAGRLAEYQRRGLSDEEATIRAMREGAALGELRARALEQQTVAQRARGPSALGNASRFAEGLGLGRTGGGSAAVTGVVAGIAVGASADAIAKATAYGQQIQNVAEQTGLATKEVQIYDLAAKQAGATTEQVSTAFAHLSDVIGRAKDGDTSLQKVFSAKVGLNIDLSQFKNLGEALPTIIDRLSKIRDPAERGAIGVKLFGEEYAKLDPLLSQGNARIAEFGEAMRGSILSDSEIENLHKASIELGELANKLQIDVAKTVGDNKTAILGLAGALSTLSGEVLKFLSSHPETALAIIGGLAGSRVGGLPGAAVGVVAGYAAGQRVGTLQADDNRDVGFRQQQLAAAQGELSVRQHSAANGSSLFSLHYNSAADGGRGSGATVQSAQAEVARQAALLAEAKAAAAPKKPAAVQPGNPGNVALAFAPKGPKGKSAQTLENEETERQGRYKDELADANERFLKAQQQLTVGTNAQLDDQEKTIKAERDKLDLHYAEQEKLKQIDAGRAKELIAANDAAAVEQLKVLALKRQVAAYNAVADAALREIDHQREILATRQPFATTAKERRGLNDKQIDLDTDATKAAATKTILSIDPQVTDEQRSAAGDDLRNADSVGAARHAENAKENQDPFSAYVDKLPKTAGQIKEKFQQAAVDGVESLNGALDHSLEKMLKLHGVAGEIVGDFIKIALHAAEAAAFKALFAGLTGGGGGILGVIGGLFGGGKATGGDVSGSKFYVVGEHGPEIFAPGQSGSIIPNHAINVGASNVRVNSAPSTIILAPQHFDLSNAVLTPDLVAQIDVRNKAYTDSVGHAVYQKSVSTATDAAPARVKRAQVLGS